MQLEDEVTAVVETDGFSLYTIEFTYNTLEYVLPGDSSVALAEILSTVGLTGEVTDVAVSNANLFSASNETGEWMITAHQAFDTTEWMTVTINGIDYQITVTDDGEAGTWADLQATINNAADGSTILLTQSYTAEGSDSALYIPDGSTLTIYGQSGDTGKLVSAPTGGAAIGGYSGHDNGIIVIHILQLDQ